MTNKAHPSKKMKLKIAAAIDSEKTTIERAMSNLSETMII
jgi:predicted transcriptional regulator